MKILVLHGPNLNLLGQREGDPPVTLEELNRTLRATATVLGIELRVLQSNHEGVLIDALHAERTWADGVVINPGALAHSSYALREAIAAVRLPTIEVHLSDLRRREPWRRVSVIKDVCVDQLLGKGVDGYRLALERLAKRTAASGAGAVTPAGARGKTIGRRRSAAGAASRHRPSAAAAPTSKGKTLGRAANLAPVPATQSLARGATSDLAGPGGKTIGRGSRAALARLETLTPTRAGASFGGLTRNQLRERIAERLSGRLSQAELSGWARTQYLALQTGGAVEADSRDEIEDALQALVAGANGMSENALITLMARLDR